MSIKYEAHFSYGYLIIITLFKIHIIQTLSKIGRTNKFNTTSKPVILTFT